nr:hypothetical protein [Tanacetum cinerariifolium]
MENTMLELVKICQEKELLCMHDNVDDLIESALNSKLLSINSQRLEKEKQEVKNVVEQPAERRPHLDFEEEIRLIENLQYDNSSPRPPEELNAVNANTIVESIPSSLIPIQYNDSQREEIDIVTNTNDVLPPGVENDDDSEGEINVVAELHVDNSISNSVNELSDNEESDFDNQSVPLPPLEPPDAEFDYKPDSEEEISVMMNDKDDDYFPFMFVIRIFLPFLICFKMFLYYISAKSEDTIFDHGISV